jgi:hypothetical protein
MMTYKSRTKTLKFNPAAARTVAADELVIRLARPEDIAAVARLSALDSAALPEGPILLAEVEGRPVAALALDGRSEPVADPFRPTVEIVGLLRLRAAQLAGDDNTPTAARALGALRTQRAA